VVTSDETRATAVTGHILAADPEPEDRGAHPVALKIGSSVRHFKRGIGFRDPPGAKGNLRALDPYQKSSERRIR